MYLAIQYIVLSNISIFGNIIIICNISLNNPIFIHSYTEDFQIFATRKSATRKPGREKLSNQSPCSMLMQLFMQNLLENA